MGYGTSVTNAEATSVFGRPSNSAPSAWVRKLSGGCITSWQYSAGTRSVSSSQPWMPISF